MIKKELKEEEVVMCTVKRIEGTTVFVDIENNGTGSINFSEVAAGRIRNLREYVSPNKKIVCKILKILDNNIQLSLRRVTAKEREEIQERYKKEHNFLTLLKAVTSNPEVIVKKIKEKYELWEFFDKIKERPSFLEGFVSKEQAFQLEKILSEKKEREKEVKKVFTIKSQSDSGINEIRESLIIPNVEIKYLGSSQFSIITTAKDFKEAEHLVNEALKEIEKRAKNRKLFFELKEK